jgi:hypothetical protein
LGLELGCNFGHFQLGGDGFVGFHVEALDPIGPIDLCDELGMEGDDHGGGHEYALGIKGPGAGNIARVEGQLNARNLASVFIRSASCLVKQALHIDVPLKWVARVEIHGYRRWTTFNLGLALHPVVNWDCPDGEGSQQSGADQDKSQNHIRCD